QLVAGLCVDADADLVRHGARGNIKRRFLAQQRRDTFLKPVDGRVFVEDVVANLRGLDGRTHSGRRPRDRVAAQVDGWFGWHEGSLFQWSCPTPGGECCEPAWSPPWLAPLATGLERMSKSYPSFSLSFSFSFFSGCWRCSRYQRFLICR